MGSLDFTTNNSPRLGVIYCSDTYDDSIQKTFSSQSVKKVGNYHELLYAINQLSVYELDTCILVEVSSETAADAFALVKTLKTNWLTRKLAIIFLLTESIPEISSKAFEQRVSDCYMPPFELSDVKLRIQYLSAYRLLHEELENLPKQPLLQYKTPVSKRLFDIASAAGALLALSPVFIVIAIMIKLDSKGPVFYKSKRVGSGYKIFSFYKFRSMRADADKLVAQLKAEANQYGDSAFFKMKDDPRVTKLGNFLRNSSLDELPQLFNVLRGDMSIVGNRPLPLYEAELLTTNEWSMRFLGPAGITGLWQIIKRGKADMSDRERKKLDNFYTKRFSVLLDVKIVLMTFPALFQKEKV